MKRKNFSAAILLIALSIIVMPKAFGQIEKFKAAFIYNFTRYIEWPSSYNPNEFVIGIIGKDNELTKELSQIAATKNVAGKVIKLVNYSFEDGIGECNILFVSSNMTGQLDAILKLVQHKSILLISDSPVGISKGSAINFIFNNNKLGFEIKASNAEQKGLKISSSLENLAIKKY